MKLKTKLKRILQKTNLALTYTVKALAIFPVTLSFVLILEIILPSNNSRQILIYDKKIKYVRDEKQFKIRYVAPNELVVREMKIPETLYKFIRKKDILELRQSRLYGLTKKYVLKRDNEIIHSQVDRTFYYVFCILSLVLLFPLAAFDKYYQFDMDRETFAILGIEAIGIGGWILLIKKIGG